MKNNRRLILQSVLFIATLITTTLAGAEWMFGRPFILVEQPLGWEHFWQGFWFSIPFLGILTVHEFGHYFMAKYHKVKVTLPYYIPLWFGLGQSIGTLGAFIRIEEVLRSRKKYFDIGIAGPLAGFVVAVALLWYGFTHLPTLDYIFKIHPEYKKFGMGFARVVYNGDMTGSIVFGDNILFWFFKTYVADPSRLPNQFEIMHYPFLLAGFLSLFFTALNLIPIGQLDGGHVMYGLIGDKATRILNPILFWGFMFYAGLGYFKPDEFVIANNDAFMTKLGGLALYIYFLHLCFSKISENPLTSWTLSLSVVFLQFCTSFLFKDIEGYSGFMAFGFLLGRVLGVYHPPTEDSAPLDWKRKALGWFALIVFVLCFSPKPFIGI